LKKVNFQLSLIIKSAADLKVSVSTCYEGFGCGLAKEETYSHPTGWGDVNLEKAGWVSCIWDRLSCLHRPMCHNPGMLHE